VRKFTYFNCTRESTIVEGIREEGVCHNCKEVIHLVEYDALTEAQHDIKRMKELILSGLENEQRLQQRVHRLEAALNKIADKHHKVIICDCMRWAREALNLKVDETPFVGAIEVDRKPNTTGGG
jgi:hypothetical protein